MGAIILKNATYISGFNLSEENTEVLKNLAKKFRVRSFNESDFGEFKKSFGQVKYHFCIISQIDDSNKSGETESRKFIDSLDISKVYLDPNDLCPEIKNTDQVIRLGKADLNGNAEEKILENLVTLVDKKITSGMKDTIQKTMEYITPIFFDCNNVNFEEKKFDPDFFDFSNNSDFDCLVSIENNFEWLVGRLVIKINSKLFAKNILKKDKDIDDILKASQEYSNQIMGIINFNLNNSGKKFKIGLPQSYDLTTSRVNLGKLLIPSMMLTTNSREIEISFGHIEMENGTVPELKVEEFSIPSSDVDFF